MHYPQRFLLSVSVSRPGQIPPAWGQPTTPSSPGSPSPTSPFGPGSYPTSPSIEPLLPPGAAEARWADRTPTLSIAGSTSTHILRPESAILDILDVPPDGTATPDPAAGSRAEEGPEGPEEEEDSANLTALGIAASTTFLTLGATQEAFNELFHLRHPDGATTLQGLQLLLEELDVALDEERLGEALAKYCPECRGPEDAVPHHVAEEIFLALKDRTHRRATLVPTGNSLMRWISALPDQQATRLLLAVVVVLCSLSAFAAAGVACGLMQQWTVGTLEAHLQEDLGTVKDMVDVYATKLFVASLQSDLKLTTNTFADVVSLVSYQMASAKQQQDLLALATFLAECADAWLAYLPARTFTDIAEVMGLWTEVGYAWGGKQEAVDAVNAINPVLPDGYEIILGQFATPANLSYEFLTNLRYDPLCNGSGCLTGKPRSSPSPMQTALSGLDGAVESHDYRQVDALVGFMSTMGLGVEYKADRAVLNEQKLRRLQALVESQQVCGRYSCQYLLGRLVGNRTTLLTNVSNCSAPCQQRLQQPTGPLGRALLQGEAGLMKLLGPGGEAVVAAYTPIGMSNYSLAILVTSSQFQADILQQTVAVIDDLNLNSSLLRAGEELELTTLQGPPGSPGLRHLTQYRFAADCPAAGCLPPEYLRQATAACTQGVTQALDYRGRMVVAAYACIPELSATLSMKVDVSAAAAQSLRVVTGVIDARNAADQGTTTDQFELFVPRDGLAAAAVEAPSDVRLHSQPKYPEACARPDCSWPADPGFRAVRGDTAVMGSADYRGVATKAAMVPDPNVAGGIGLVLEEDVSEFLHPIYVTMGIILGFTVAVLLLCTLALVVLTQRLMLSMITAKEEGQRAVVYEKERFGKVVASMYPAFLLPRLMDGEKQLVCELPNATVFFSDIHDFTAASNTLGSQELLRLMGYIYGTMDALAEHHGVYKVKTIGDAYLALTGLPHSPSDTSALDMLRFAACVAQVFSPEFVHPAEGQVLALLGTASAARTRALIRASNDTSNVSSDSDGDGAPTSPRRLPQVPQSSLALKLPQGPRPSVAVSPRKPLAPGPRPSVAPGMATHRANSDASVRFPQSTTRTRASSRSSVSVQPHVRCIMSYGLSNGPVVAGVLQGRCPMFDIWGRTVNLASRMQSTGQPGRIQVSEHVFRKVVAVPNQPFIFEASRSTYCKGFGEINAHFVRGTTEAVPPDVQQLLRLEPHFAPFHFDQVVERPGPPPKGPASPKLLAGPLQPPKGRSPSQH